MADYYEYSIPELIKLLGARFQVMRGKLSEWTKDDTLTLAKENSIRKAEAIIAEVAETVKTFRPFAEKHQAQNRWIAAIEQTLTAHLNAWGLPSTKKGISLSLNGHELTDVHVEQTYKGNSHLMANIDGTHRKFVISKNKEEHPFIESTGVLNLSEEYLAKLVEKYLLR